MMTKIAVIWWLSYIYMLITVAHIRTGCHGANISNTTSEDCCRKGGVSFDEDQGGRCTLLECEPVDCEWRYSNYSECVEERQFIFPIILMYPKYGGLPCPRFVSEGQPVSRPCYDGNNTVDCLWEYTPYSECIRIDGCKGLQFRLPVILQQPQFGGTPCPSFELDRELNRRPCYVDNCEDFEGDCYSEWSRWSSCTATCDSGLRHRFRRILDDTGDCNENLIDIEPCYNLPCPVDCQWEWGEFSECSASCGGGMRYRKPIITQYPEYGGLCPQFVYLNETEVQSCNDDVICPEVQIALERSAYEVIESIGLLVICAEAISSDALCPISSPIVVHLLDLNNSAGFQDYVIMTHNLTFDSCMKSCISVNITDDNLAEGVEYFNVYLQESSSLPDWISVSSNISSVIILDNDAMVIGFQTKHIVARESDMKATVCVDLINSPYGALEPFVAAVIPAEDFQRSTNEYILECKRNLEFSVGSHHECFNYTIIDDDDCELRENATFFEVHLSLLSTTETGVNINSNRSFAEVIIDDSKEEECYVHVGYEHSSYTLTEVDGYVQLCVNSTSTGISADFSVMLKTNNTGNLKLEQSSTSLSFSVYETVSVEQQCYNISVDFEVSDICNNFLECRNLSFLTYFENLNGSAQVLFDISEVEVLTIIPHNCSSRCFNLESSFMAILTSPSSSNPSTNPSSSEGPVPSTLSSGAIAAVVSLSGLVLVAIAVIVIVILCFYKRTQNLHVSRHEKPESSVEEHHYSNVKSSQFELPAELKQELQNKRMIFGKDELQLSSAVGQGESGLVYKAYLDTAIGKELVAVKTGKSLFSKTDVARLVKEVSTMLSFEHSHVMSLIGVCLDGEMPLLIMPFMSNGSLLDYLKHHKHELLLLAAEAQQIQAARKVLLGMCYQISKGMEYLAQQKFVHRDLAARNCMIDHTWEIKVADFGLTEDMYGTNYFRREKGGSPNDEKVPIRWMAPESIEEDIYTEATDVWSFGVTVWEIFTCGRIPYAGVPAMNLLEALKEGQRLEEPDNEACFSEVYQVVSQCWQMDSQKRPKFLKLVETFNNLLETESEYLRLMPSVKDSVVPPSSLVLQPSPAGNEHATS